MEDSQSHRRTSLSSALLLHAGAMLTVCMWGVSFVSTKVLLDHGLNSVEIYIYRFILAYLCVLLFCHKQIWSNSWHHEFLFMLVGLCGGSLYFIAENMALEYTLVTNVSLITSLSPLLTTMLVGLLYKSERPSRGFIFGSLVAVVGVGCVIFNSSFVVEVNPLGDLLALLAAVCFAVYSIILRKLNAEYSVSFITRKTFFYGLLTAIPFWIMEPDAVPFAEFALPEVWANLLFLGLGASVLAYVMWARTVKNLGAVKASNYLYGQPIVTFVASVAFLGEPLMLMGVLGCILIIGGLWLGDFLSRRGI
mgnify:CR=1 FL=1